MNARVDNLPYNRAHGRMWGYGIAWRPRHRPWIVKFKRNGKSVYVGSYLRLPEAILAAERFLRNERKCPPQPPAKPTPMSTTSGTKP